MGADRAIWVETEAMPGGLAVARLLAQVVREEAPGLVILGKQAIDSDNNQTGQMLAALLDWPQATFASKLVVTGTEAEVTREIDGGLQTLAVKLPAVVTTDLRLNTPRYIKLPDIMKAKRKPIAHTSPATLGVEPGAGLRLIGVTPPAERAGGIKVDSVAALVDALKNQARVL
jgi:electron transfer flavoprotein beta subunit